MSQNEMAVRPAAPGAAARQDGTPSELNISSAERIASMAAGTALAAFGISRRSPAGIAMALAGAAIVWRGASGHCPVYAAAGVDTAVEEKKPVQGEAVVTVHRPRAECYRFWRDVNNLPRFMDKLKSAVDLGDGRTRWTIRERDGRTYQFDTEIIAEKPNALITWRTIEGSEVNLTGSVRFVSRPAGRGTEVRLSVEYQLPAGLLAGLARRFMDPTAELHEDLRRFKQLIEAGEIATTRDQPAGK